MYADDLAAPKQSTDVAPIEEILTSALVGLSEHYTTNQSPIPTRNRSATDYLRNREYGKQFNISCPVYRCNVSRWLNLNKLSLNVKKTKAMAFHMPQKKIIHPNIQINGSNIEFVDNFVFLGITINNKLNWNSHINKVTNKISKTVGIVNKLRSFLPSGVLQTIYNTLILPHMTYGILAWGRHTNTIYKIQKRAIRIIAASKYNAHTEPMFKQLNLLKACDICKLQE